MQGAVEDGDGVAGELDGTYLGARTMTLPPIRRFQTLLVVEVFIRF